MKAIRSKEWDDWTDEERIEYELIYTQILFGKREEAERARERLRQLLIRIAAARRSAIWSNKSQ